MSYIQLYTFLPSLSAVEYFVLCQIRAPAPLGLLSAWFLTVAIDKRVLEAIYLSAVALMCDKLLNPPSFSPIFVSHSEADAADPRCSGTC